MEVAELCGKLTFDGSIEGIKCVTDREDYHAVTKKMSFYMLVRFSKGKMEEDIVTMVFQKVSEYCYCYFIFIWVGITKMFGKCQPTDSLSKQKKPRFHIACKKA